MPKKPPKLCLISDLDDTIKISHTQNRWIMVYRGLFSSSVFAGMPELYQELKPTSFYIVSSSPKQIRPKIELLLQKNHFPEATIYLRNWFRERSIPKYKLNRILGIVKKAASPIILIGDDSEHDPEIFLKVLKRHPNKIKAIYIRAVRGRSLPKPIQSFYTAFDLACAEHSAKRLSNKQVLRIGDAILRTKKNARLLPRFALKPPLHFKPSLAKSDRKLFPVWHKIQRKIESIPKRRHAL